MPFKIVRIGKSGKFKKVGVPKIEKHKDNLYPVSDNSKDTDKYPPTRYGAKDKFTYLKPKNVLEINLSAGAACMYDILCYFAERFKNPFWMPDIGGKFSMATYMKQRKLNNRTSYWRYRKELEKKGLIKILEKGKPGRATKYLICDLCKAIHRKDSSTSSDTVKKNESEAKSDDNNETDDMALQLVRFWSEQFEEKHETKYTFLKSDVPIMKQAMESIPIKTIQQITEWLFHTRQTDYPTPTILLLKSNYIQDIRVKTENWVKKSRKIVENILDQAKKGRLTKFGDEWRYHDGNRLEIVPDWLKPKIERLLPRNMKVNDE